MTDFVKFPHTPHIVWLSSTPPRADKVLDRAEVESFLHGDEGEVVVEEKVDGANVGVSVDARGELQVQNRGTILGRGAHPQFQALWPWLAARREALLQALGRDLILFGEWCFAVHSVTYTRLPDWFLGFDVYDRAAGRFWSTRRRDELLRAASVAAVPHIARGRFRVAELEAMLGPSRLTDGPMEGVYVRREDDDWLIARAKLVRAEFVQAIGDHWSSQQLRKNALAEGAGELVPPSRRR